MVRECRVIQGARSVRHDEGAQQEAPGTLAGGGAKGAGYRFTLLRLTCPLTKKNYHQSESVCPRRPLSGRK